MKKAKMILGNFYRRPDWKPSLCIQPYITNYGDTAYRYYEDGYNKHSDARGTMENNDFYEVSQKGERCLHNAFSTCNHYKSMGTCEGCKGAVKVKIEEVKLNIKGNSMLNNVNYIGGDYNLVEVSFELNGPNLGKQYIYKVDIDMKLEEGELVVVESSTGYGLVRVIKVFKDNLLNTEKAKKAKAWVASKLNLENHLMKKEATERREYIMNKLEEKSKQMETIKMYALLSELDPEAKKLVDELKTLK